MKRIILIAILVVLLLTPAVLGEERILVKEYFGQLRWCPDDNSIAFVANFEKYDPSIRNSGRFQAVGIGRVKTDGSGLQIIVSEPWWCLTSRGIFYEDGTRWEDMETRIRQRVRTAPPAGPGGYRSPTDSPPKATTPTPFLSQQTPFEWSADGKKIIFAEPLGLPTGIDQYIWIVNADGTGLRPIWKAGTIEGLGGALPRLEDLPVRLQRLENGKIAFLTRRQARIEAERGFFRCLDPETGNIENKKLNTGPYDCPYESSILSPNGKMVLYEGNLEEHGDIFVVNLATGAKTNLTRSASQGMCSLPTWSPDSKQIVFEFEPKRNSSGRQTQVVSIWVIDANGANCRPVAPYTTTETREWVKDRYPTWSPGGRTISFIREHHKEKSEYSIEVAAIDDGSRRVAAAPEVKLENGLARKD